MRLLHKLLIALAAVLTLVGFVATIVLTIVVDPTWFLAVMCIAAGTAVAAGYGHRISDERESAKLRHPAFRTGVVSASAIGIQIPRQSDRRGEDPSWGQYFRNGGQL